MQTRLLDRIIPFNIRGLWVFVVTASATAFFGSVIIIHSFVNKNADVTVYVRPWTVVILWAAGITVEIHNADRVPDPGYLVLANHQSFFDIIATLNAFPDSVRFVAKMELFAIPIMGRGMECLGHIKINRRNREAAIESLRIAGERVRGGIPVLAFPEGTRNRELGQLAPFKKGAFHLAQQLQAPVVPMWIEDSGKVNPPATLIVRKTKIVLHVGEVIQPAEISDDIDELMRDVRARIWDAQYS